MDEVLLHHNALLRGLGEREVHLRGSKFW